jgi:hypothetical protein
MARAEILTGTRGRLPTTNRRHCTRLIVC